MGDLPIQYRLPTTAVRFHGTATTVRDELDRILRDDGRIRDQRAVEAVAEAITIADTVELTAVVEQRALKDGDVEIQLTRDGRLTSATSTSTGRAGTMLGTAVTLAGVAAGVALAGPAALPLAAMTTRRLLQGLPSEVIEQAGEEEEPGAADPVLEAYAREHPREAARLASLRAIVARTEHELVGDIDRAGTAPTREALIAVRRRQAALAAARSELDRVQEHLRLWRASKLSERTEALERVVPLDTVRLAGAAIRDGKLTLTGDASARTAVQQVWDELGLVAVIEDDPSTQQPTIHPTDKRIAGVWVRIPRPVLIATYRRRDRASDHAELVERTRMLVVDGRSRLDRIDFRSSMWAKRSIALDIGADGGVTRYASGATSSGASIADAIGAAPGAFVAGLGQVGTAAERAETLRTGQRARALARLKQEIEYAQQRLVAAGLEATAADRLELERLQQRKAVLEAGTGVASAAAVGPEAASELAQLEHRLAQLELEAKLAALDGSPSEDGSPS